MENNNSINVTATNGTDNSTIGNRKDVKSVEPQPQPSEKLPELWEALPQHIEGLLQTLERTTNEAINVSAVSGIGNTVNDNNIKVIGQQVILPSPPAEHLPEKWQVPPQNPDFTGREGLLKQIEDHYSKKNVPVVLTTTHGLGGIGKTQLTIEFVWQHYQKYKGVVWFNAENLNSLLYDYIRLGIELNILHQDDKDGIEERALLVKHWLEDPKHADWLLIYDNAPKYGGDDQEGVGDLFPTRGGKMLITSRNTQWPQASIQVYVFTSEESRAYIQIVLLSKASDSNQVDTLATTLGPLPLALAQACAYIKKTPINIKRYLELYERRKKELLSDKTLADQTLKPDSNRAIVYITWDITMEAVRKESLLADKWLSLCAYLGSHAVYDTSKRVLGTAHPITKNALQGLEQLGAKTASQTSYEVNDQLFVAAKSGDVQWVRDCIREIANVNARDNNNWTPLHYAAENGHIAIVDILLQNDASINAENNGKATPLHFAVRNGHITVVEALLSSGAMVNATTQSNWTPLHFAAKQGHIEVVKALLKYGADVNAKNKASKTALNLAAENNHLGLAVVLLNHDYINTTDLNEQQRNELTSYIFEHHPDQAELLIAKLF